MNEAWKKAGLHREKLVLWNVVPQWIGGDTPTTQQIEDAIPDTQRFIVCIKDLRVIVFCRLSAQKAILQLQFPKDVAVLGTYHPSQRSYSHQARRADIHRTFGLAAKLVKLKAWP